MKKTLTLKRETLEALTAPLVREARGQFSGIGTCVYCNVTKLGGGCFPTTGCPQ